MFKPKSLVEAYSLARIQEECLSNIAKGLRPLGRSAPFFSSTRSMSAELPIGEGKGPLLRANPIGQFRSNASSLGLQGSSPSKGPNANQALVPAQRITQAQMKDRRRRGLCYSCDTKWTRGHVCAVPKLFLIEAVQKVEVGEETHAAPAEEDPNEFFLEEFPEISLNALTGTPNPRTMQILGVLRYHQVVILIDFGSIHNFVDTKLAASLVIQPQPQDSIRVQIANGQEVVSPGCSRAVEVKL
jgi:hypothetical protein